MKFLVLFLMIFGFSSQAFEMKTVSVTGYSKVWLVLYENEKSLNEAVRGKIHFHGFTQDQKTGAAFEPQYDFAWPDGSKMPSEEQLRHFVSGYELQREVQNHPNHILLIPISRGHCDQYPELYDPAKFDEVFSKVLAAAGVSESKFTLTMASAHSGGGELLSRLLDKNAASKFFSKVVRADFYDGIYSAASTARLKNWINAAFPRELRLFSIPKQTPAIYGEKIFQTVQGKAQSTYKMVGEIRATERTKKSFSESKVFVVQGAEKSLNHWSLVKTFWVY